MKNIHLKVENKKIIETPAHKYNLKTMNRQITSRHPNFQLSLTATHNKVIANLNVLFTKATTLVPNNLSLKLHHFLTVYLSYTQLYIKCLIIIHNWLVHSGFVCHDRNKCRGKMNSWGGKCVKNIKSRNTNKIMKMRYMKVEFEDFKKNIMRTK